jgi:hypothetical protein
VSVPAAVIKSLAPEASYGWAQRRMLRAYHAFVRATGRPPTAMLVGRQLHDLYERDVPLIRRWTEDPSSCVAVPGGLKFKALTLRVSGAGTEVRVT